MHTSEFVSYNTLLIYDLFRYLTVIQVWILIFVVYVFAYILMTSPTISRVFPLLVKSPYLEAGWTLVPAISLLAIMIPLTIALFTVDDLGPYHDTLLLVGNQWFWVYSTPTTEAAIYLQPDVSLELGQLRLLTTTHSLVIPHNTPFRVLLGANDVIHSYAVPALGVKQDAIPGRLNASTIYASTPGSYYGQCSELCGALHGFMPLTVEVV